MIGARFRLFRDDAPLSSAQLRYQDWSNSLLDDAVAYFEQAVDIDPGFARAWAYLAATADVAPEWGYHGRDFAALATDAAERAIELNPDLALPYAVLGAALDRSKPIDYESMLAYLGEALARDPKETTVYLWRGITYIEIGYFDLAIRDFRSCLDLDPAYMNCQSHLAMTYLLSGEPDRALAEYEVSLMNGFTGNVMPFLFLLAERGEPGRILWAVSHWNDGINTPKAAEFEYRAYTSPPFDYEAERVQLGAAYIPTGGTEPAWGPQNDDFNLLFGNYAAIDTNYYPFWWFPYPKVFHESPHPRRLIRELGLLAHWQKHGFPDHCRPVGDDDFACD